jgi:hypothetical protein
LSRCQSVVRGATIIAFILSPLNGL